MLRTAGNTEQIKCMYENLCWDIKIFEEQAIRYNITVEIIFFYASIAELHYPQWEQC